ncbi:RNA 2',3'-cyclic phosphodiesterase [Sedimenticola hydrogenitrophicus]|uniref:RNA 2',3'-cyclic phosphodiesterase n=1 Tax=Sedimenticola hydrogenitrophicus TaxID=2967975 RepID=UPI0021A93DE8|nr:RNA 2',3'-cyclic phosphodiesterase [Sedimenticola hydrogenitrophicus]
MKRLFLALDIPDAIKEVLLAFQPKPGVGLRPLSREGLHLTLCFIGVADIERVHQAVRSVQTREFSLQIKGLGRLHPARGGVLWAGVEPSEELTLLQKRLSAALQQAGFQAEAREFHPHITLARCKPGVSRVKIERFLAQGERLDPGPIRVREFVLFSSDTRPEGAVYQLERSYPLHSSDESEP